MARPLATALLLSVAACAADNAADPADLGGGKEDRVDGRSSAGDVLATALTDARPQFIDAAKAYVRFALDHPGHYEVMFDKSLYDDTDPGLVAASSAAGAELNRGVGTLADPKAAADPAGAALAAWSLVHGFSMLWLNDAIDTAGDPIARVESLAAILFDG